MNTIAVSPTDANFVIVGGLDLWRSTDGGATFSIISNSTCYPSCVFGQSAHADQHTIVFDPAFDGSTNKKVFVGNDGGIQMTTDISTIGGPYGVGWINLANGLGITQFYGGAAARDGSYIIGGTQDNRTLQFVGGVNNWYQWIRGDGGYCAIDFNDPTVAFEEAQYLQLYRSFDRGDIYAPAYLGLGDAGDINKALFLAPFVMDPNNSLKLVAGGQSIWKTDNSAEIWNLIRPPLPDVGGRSPLCSAIDIAKGNSSVIWIGYSTGTVSFTTNGGATWTNVDETLPALPDRFVTDIAINPTDSKEVIVTFGGYATNSIWLTTNSGDAWILRQGFGTTQVPALQVNTVRYHPSNTNWVYVGTDLGVFASEDKGIAWNITPAFGQHDAPANVEVDELFGMNISIAATHGRGMYRCRPLPIVFIDGAYS